MQTKLLSSRVLYPLSPSSPGSLAGKIIPQRTRIVYPLIGTWRQYPTNRAHLHSMATFTLDKSIFNQTLYKKIQSAFLEGVELGAKDVDPAVLKRWFTGTPQEKLAFDNVCRERFGDALEAIGPEQFPRPSAEPLIRELNEMVEKDAAGDGSDVAWTALSMTLLLDQVPRNIFRTNEGLVKVYNHYDEIAHSLVKILLSAQSPIGRPDLHPQWRLSLFYRMWFYMPLMHSEEVASHDLYNQIMNEFEEDLRREEGNEAMLGFLTRGLESEKEHRDILNRFGRYPHRNQALGRTSTPEEIRFLEEGGATFGVAQDKAEA